MPVVAIPEFIKIIDINSWRLNIWVQPGASRNSLDGEYQGCLKIRVNAPANDNKANKAVIAYVASVLGLRKNQVLLERGRTSRRKMLRIASNAELHTKLASNG